MNKTMRYELIARVDNFNEEAWEEFGKVDNIESASKWMLQMCECEPEDYYELPVVDGIVDENEEYVLTYLDAGMCEEVNLFKKIHI